MESFFLERVEFECVAPGFVYIYTGSFVFLSCLETRLGINIFVYVVRRKGGRIERGM